MNTPSAETRIARIFGLYGDRWTRHANPLSVWTRFLILPLYAAAIWSRDWIGWWCLVPVALITAFLMANPLLFAKPASTRSWASKSVFGERVYSQRATVPIPEQYRGQAMNVANVANGLGLLLLIQGLVALDLLSVLGGLLLSQTGKAWYLDRMVLLYEDLKRTVPEYASWEY